MNYSEKDFTGMETSELNLISNRMLHGTTLDTRQHCFNSEVIYAAVRGLVSLWALLLRTQLFYGLQHNLTIKKTLNTTTGGKTLFI